MDDAMTRLPGNLHELAYTLPDDTRSTLRAAGKAVEQSLADLLCMRVVSTLGREHRILTFITANSNRVMRIQPPLIVTEEEVNRFVKATSSVCESVQHLLSHGNR